MYFSGFSALIKINHNLEHPLKGQQFLVSTLLNGPNLPFRSRKGKRRITLCSTLFYGEWKMFFHRHEEYRNTEITKYIFCNSFLRRLTTAVFPIIIVNSLVIYSEKKSEYEPTLKELTTAKEVVMLLSCNSKCFKMDHALQLAQPWQTYRVN